MMTVFFRKLLLAPLLICALCLMAAAPAGAAETKTFTVLPFKVNGPSGYNYLGDSIPGMLSSRLYWQGNFEPLQNSAGVPANEAAAEKVRSSVGSDYVIWGSVTVVGDNCSLDVRVRDAAGTVWPQSVETTVGQLIPSLKGVSDKINGEIFKRPQAAAQPAPSGQPGPRNQMNPQLVQNQTTPQRPYMNPNFRYSGAREDDSRIRSQTLPFAALGMEVCDADGDGRNEVFLLADHRIYAYRFDGDRLDPLAEFALPMTQQALAIRSIDLDGTRRPKIVVTAHDAGDSPISRILSFDGKSFKEEAKTLQFFVNVAKLPPLYTPTLIGQGAQPPKLFTPGVFEVEVRGGEMRRGRPISVPEGGDVFNFAWIPEGYKADDTAKVLMLTSDEKLRVYSPKGTRMFESDEEYSGSVQGIEVNVAMPGMGRDDVTQGRVYYVPMRMLVLNLAGDDQYEVIVNKPITTAGKLFDRYRSFPESEVQSLYWDGLGLSMLWKTRRIKGSVCDYAVDDVNNDGIVDLALCVNTHPGAIGVAARKSMVVFYPLDTTKMDPSATTYDEELGYR